MERTTIQDLNEWFQSPAGATDDGLLLKLERVSIRALATYAAHQHGVDENVVLAIAAAHVGVNDIDQIRRMDYVKATRYLVDMNPKEIIN